MQITPVFITERLGDIMLINDSRANENPEKVKGFLMSHRISSNVFWFSWSLTGLFMLPAAWAQPTAQPTASATLTPSTVGPEQYVVKPEYPLISRIGLWDGTRFNRLTAQNSVTASRVYILVHGWGIGSDQSVAAYTGQPPVEVWDPQIVDNDGHPAGGWLNKLAAAIQADDPQAAILAYTWIDESATDTNPLSAYISESHTELNGRRLAESMADVLPYGANRQVHLIGFSHGSKVATVAAINMNPYPRQLTILDSPEKLLTRLGGAANGLQYYLPSLPIGRDDNSVFVDNYYSEFGDPLNGIPGLQGVIDVDLNPLTYDDIEFSQRHSYSPEWYTTATISFNPSASPAGTALGITLGQGIGWSPFYGNAYQKLSAAYRQDWAGVEGKPEPSRELDLRGQVDFNSPNLVTTHNPLVLTPVSSKGNVVQNPDGTLILDDADGNAFWSAGFDLTDKDTSILFDSQFIVPGEGDQLGIWIDDDLRYVMTGSVAGANRPNRSAISISALEAGHHVLTVALYKLDNSQATASVGNFLLVSDVNWQSSPLLLELGQCGVALLSGLPMLIPTFIGGLWMIRRSVRKTSPRR